MPISLSTAYAGKVKFNVVVEDYALDATKAQNDMNTFKSDGISVVVGPLNSGTAQALLSFANSNQIVMISPSSTSNALAIPNDYLFRTAPTDIIQGKADAAMMWGDGVKAIIQVYRQDTYGSGLANFTPAAFTADGGIVVDQYHMIRLPQTSYQSSARSTLTGMPRLRSTAMIPSQFR